MHLNYIYFIPALQKVRYLTPGLGVPGLHPLLFDWSFIALVNTRCLCSLMSPLLSFCFVFNLLLLFCFISNSLSQQLLATASDWHLWLPLGSSLRAWLAGALRVWGGPGHWATSAVPCGSCLSCHCVLWHLQGSFLGVSSLYLIKESLWNQVNSLPMATELLSSWAQSLY